eukprot:1191911-Prorocentrum_minimum.AAC.10
MGGRCPCRAVVFGLDREPRQYSRTAPSRSANCSEAESRATLRGRACGDETPGPSRVNCLGCLGCTVSGVSGELSQVNCLGCLGCTVSGVSGELSRVNCLGCLGCTVLGVLFWVSRVNCLGCLGCTVSGELSRVSRVYCLGCTVSGVSGELSPVSRVYCLGCTVSGVSAELSRALNLMESTCAGRIIDQMTYEKATNVVTSMNIVAAGKAMQYMDSRVSRAQCSLNVP